MSHNLVSYALYQAGWIACVVAAGRGRPWLGTGVAVGLIALHVWLVTDRRTELRVMAGVGLLGFVADSCLAALGSLRYPPDHTWLGLAPPWVAVLWMQFAPLLGFGLRWLLPRPGWAAGLGAIGGPIAYLAGERIGAVAFGSPRILSLIQLAATWALVLPVAIVFTRRARGADHGSYRWPS